MVEHTTTQKIPLYLPKPTLQKVINLARNHYECENPTDWQIASVLSLCSDQDMIQIMTCQFLEFADFDPLAQAQTWPVKYRDQYISIMGMAVQRPSVSQPNPTQAYIAWLEQSYSSLHTILFHNNEFFTHQYCVHDCSDQSCSLTRSITRYDLLIEAYIYLPDYRDQIRPFIDRKNLGQLTRLVQIIDQANTDLVALAQVTHQVSPKNDPKLTVYLIACIQKALSPQNPASGILYQIHDDFMSLIIRKDEDKEKTDCLSAEILAQISV